jgi:hypothetical protein
LNKLLDEIPLGVEGAIPEGDEQASPVAAAGKSFRALHTVSAPPPVPPPSAGKAPPHDSPFEPDTHKSLDTSVASGMDAAVTASSSGRPKGAVGSTPPPAAMKVLFAGEVSGALGASGTASPSDSVDSYSITGRNAGHTLTVTIRNDRADRPPPPLLFVDVKLSAQVCPLVHSCACAHAAIQALFPGLF